MTEEEQLEVLTDTLNFTEAFFEHKFEEVEIRAAELGFDRYSGDWYRYIDREQDKVLALYSRNSD
jgi:hypothetical protein